MSDAAAPPGLAQRLVHLWEKRDTPEARQLFRYTHGVGHLDGRVLRRPGPRLRRLPPLGRGRQHRLRQRRGQRPVLLPDPQLGVGEGRPVAPGEGDHPVLDDVRARQSPFSILGASVAKHVGQRLGSSHFEQTVLVELANLTSFAIFWVAKYLVFNRIFRSTPSRSSTSSSKPPDPDRTVTASWPAGRAHRGARPGHGRVPGQRRRDGRGAHHRPGRGVTRGLAVRPRRRRRRAGRPRRTGRRGGAAARALGPAVGAAPRGRRACSSSSACSGCARPSCGRPASRPSTTRTPSSPSRWRELAGRHGRPSGRDATAFTVAFKGVFLEGLEVVVIVITLGSTSAPTGPGRRGRRRRPRSWWRAGRAGRPPPAVGRPRERHEDGRRSDAGQLRHVLVGGGGPRRLARIRPGHPGPGRPATGWWPGCWSSPRRTAGRPVAGRASAGEATRG